MNKKPQRGLRQLSELKPEEMTFSEIVRLYGPHAEKCSCDGCKEILRL